MLGSALASQWPEFIAETPFHSIMIGLIATFAFGLIWLMSKRNLFAVLAVLSFLLMTAAIIVERVLVTDQEKISQTLDELADAVRSNNEAELLLWISDRAPEVEQAARGHLKRFEIDYCSITWKELAAINGNANPPEADVRFSAFVRAQERSEGGLEGGDVIGIKLRMQKESDGEWRVVDYALYNPRNGSGLTY
ncbi:MAG: hypothetical protein ACKO0N_12385 [Planctomycetota bacterium]